MTTQGALKRRGRKRKQGYRSPSGRLQTPRENMRLVVEAQPHRRDLPEGSRHDELAESPLGRLVLFGWITRNEHEAAKKYHGIVHRYWAVVGAPDPTMQPVPGSGGDIPYDEAERRKAAYHKARHALIEAGTGAASAVSAVVLYGVVPDYVTATSLRCGLGQLLKHFGLPDDRKSDNR